MRFVFGTPHPLGFLGGEKADDAGLLIGQTELLVAALGPLQADLQPASEALEAAKALYASQEYSKAVAQAIRAGALAVSLNERFSAYMAAWKDLQACREELESLGFPTDVLDIALEAADKAVAHRVAEDGTTVPDYLGARAMLSRAIVEAHSVVEDARAASREIFLASLAVEALSDSPPSVAPSPLMLRLEEMVGRATEELALGHLPGASRMASEAKARADSILAGAARVYEALDLASAILDGLEAEGPMAEGLAEKIAAARDALDRKLLDKTTGLEVARRVSSEVAAFSKHYPPARKLLEHAEQIRARLLNEGFRSEDVDSALAEAGGALGAGDWTRVKESVGRASLVFVQLQEDRATLARAIEEVDARVGVLKVCRLRMLPEVEELLSHAREHADKYRLPAAREILLHANALMMQATLAGS